MIVQHQTRPHGQAPSRRTAHPMRQNTMIRLLMIVGGILCALAWLASLVATSFAPVTVCAGLAAMLVLTGSGPGRSARHRR